MTDQQPEGTREAKTREPDPSEVLPSLERPEDPDDPALHADTLGIDDTDTALATEDASDPAE